MKIEIIEDSSLGGFTARISKTTMADIRSRKFASIFAPQEDNIDIDSPSEQKYQIIVEDDKSINGKLLVSTECKKMFYSNTTSIEA